MSKALGLSVPAVATALQQLGRLDIVLETTGQRRNRFFAYHTYLKMLNDESIESKKTDEK